MSAGSTLIVSPDRSFCRIIDEREIAAFPAARQRLGHFLERQVGKPHRHAHLAADLGGERHVLCASLSAKRGGSKTSGRKWSARPSKVRRAR